MKSHGALLKRLRYPGPVSALWEFLSFTITTDSHTVCNHLPLQISVLASYYIRSFGIRPSSFGHSQVELSYLQPEVEVFHWVVCAIHLHLWHGKHLHSNYVNFYYVPSFPSIQWMKHIAQCKCTKRFDRKKGRRGVATLSNYHPQPHPLNLWSVPAGLLLCLPFKDGEIWVLQIIYCAISFPRAITSSVARSFVLARYLAIR